MVTDDQRRCNRPAYVPQPIKAFLKRSVVEETVAAEPQGTGTSKLANGLIEYGMAHLILVRGADSRNKRR